VCIRQRIKGSSSLLSAIFISKQVLIVTDFIYENSAQERKTKKWSTSEADRNFFEKFCGF